MCLVVSVLSLLGEASGYNVNFPANLSNKALSTINRRQLLMTGATGIFPFLLRESAFAEEVGAPSRIEMKLFEDPLFILSVPKGFFTLRRTQKGDLPDSKTGNGRRGSSIFTAGNMAKAEVIAVERYPVQVLLAENGISPTGDLTSFPALGDASVIASLIVARREKDSINQGTRKIENLSVSPEGKQLTFRLRTEIEVQKPELLMEQFGVSQLFRITVAKASLEAADGNILVIFASALEQDFNNGIDGPALEESVNSFVALKQTSY